VRAAAHHFAQEYVAAGRYEPAIEKLFSLSDVDYLQVNSATAGCFTFRIDRGDDEASSAKQRGGGG
jgi:hypothetical protein